MQSEHHFYGLVVRNTVGLDCLGHHVDSLYVFAENWISGEHRLHAMPCPHWIWEVWDSDLVLVALPSRILKVNAAFTQQIMPVSFGTKLHIYLIKKKMLMLKYKPHLFLLSLSDYKSFICASSVWSTWGAKTFSRDIQKSVAGSTRQPMKSTERTTFPYLRSASLYGNKAITVCCMRFQRMGSGKRRREKMGTVWTVSSWSFYSMFRLMEMSANYSAKTSAC